MRLDMEIVVDRPIHEVFDAWADKEASPTWAAPVDEVRKLTDGPVGVGTKFSEIARVPGGRVENVIEITAFEPPDFMAGTWSGGMQGSWESSFSRIDAGSTKLRLNVDVSPTGWMGKLEPLIGGVVRKKMSKDIESFKRSVETAATPG